MNDSDYSKLSTAELIERIAIHADGGALDHLLSYRKLFKLEGAWCLLPDFLSILSEKSFAAYIFIRSNEKAVDEKIDLCYDLTLKKFSNLKPEVGTPTIDGPYCNSYYERLHHMTSAIASQPMKSEIERETEIAKLFSNLVIEMVSYSWLEACRKTDKLFRRYRWQVKGAEIDLRRPIWINVPRFRNWLQKNIESPHKGAKERIQKQIYNRFGFGGRVSWPEDERQSFIPGTYIEPGPEESGEYEENNLYLQVANEKADAIDEQRPAIRELGKKKLKRMVLKILNNFTEKDYRDIKIAQEFHLTKPTFSRFAGSDRQKSVKDKKSPVTPDLWRNMAKVLHQDPYFMEAVSEFGLKQNLDMILKEIA